MNLIDRLKEYDDFSSSEKVAAVFIADNVDACLKMSVDKIGDLSYTSGSTVSRVIKKLGFENFGDFKMRLAKDNESYRHKTDINAPFSSNDSVEEIVKKMRNLFIDSIDSVIDNIDTDSLVRAAQKIARGCEINLYGEGQSYYLCKDFAEKMKRIGIKANCPTARSEMWTQAFTQNEKDMVIIVSFHGSANHYIQLVDLMKRRKVTCVTITGEDGNPLSRLGNINICCRSHEKYDKIAAFESRNQMTFVLDLLFAYVFCQDYEGNLKKVKENMIDVYRARGIKY